MFRRVITLFLAMTIGLGLAGISAEASALPYTIGGIQFLDYDNQALDRLAPNQNVFIKVQVTKNDSEAPDGYLIFCIYKPDNKLYGTSITLADIYANLPANLAVSMKMPDDIQGCRLKVFVWDSLKTQKPLSDVVSIELAEPDGSLPQPTIDPRYIARVEGLVESTKYSGYNYGSLNKDEIKFSVLYEYVNDNGNLIKVTPGDSRYNLGDYILTLKVPDTKAEKLLQQNCTALIDMSGYTYKLLDIEPIQELNQMLTISGDDIIYNECAIPDINSAWDLRYDNGGEKTATIDAYATYYCNGSQRKNTRNSIAELSPFEILRDAITNLNAIEGNVVLLNNDADSDYDAVFITENKDFVVNQVDTNNYKIVDTTLTLRSVIFDMDNQDYDIRFVKDGEPATFGDIKKGDVLSICGYINPQNKELEFGTVTIVSEKVEGMILEFNGGNKEVTIGDKIYKYVDGVDISRLVPGNEGIFYLNANGKIIAVAVSQTAKNRLALFTKIGSSGGISSSVQARALLPTGEWKTFDFASKINLNESYGTVNPENIDWSVPPANGGGGAGGVLYGIDAWLVYKIAYYNVNSDGKINKIDFYYDSSDIDSNFYMKTIVNAYYDAQNKKFSGYPYYLTDSTVIYNVPDVDAVSLTEDDISIAKPDLLVDGCDYGTVYVYNYNGNNEVPVLLGSKFEGIINYGDNFMVVDTVSVALGGDGDLVTKVTGYQKGEKVGIILNNDTVYEKIDFSTGDVYPADYLDLVRGCVIYYTKDAMGEADKVQLLFNASCLKGYSNLELPFELRNRNSITLFAKMTGNDIYRFIFGYANSVYSSRYRFSTEPTTGIAFDGEYQFATGASIVKYEPYYYTYGGRISIGTPGDIDTDDNLDTNIDGDYVFARVDSTNRIVDAIIIKHKF